MKTLITGGAGYLGSVVAQQLLGSGQQVRVFDSLLHGGESLLNLYPQDGFEFIQGDIRSRDATAAACQGVDAVVHLAAIVGDPACARQPELAHAVNYDASMALFELCQNSGVDKFIFASTCSNYGKMKDTEGYVAETSELNPVSLYAQDKVAFEKFLLAQPEKAPATTVLRFATLYGLSPRMRFDLTVNEFSKEMQTKQHLVVYGEQFWRPYVHVRDAARAVLDVLGADGGLHHGQVYNVGSTGENFTKGALVELIQNKVDKPVTIERVHKDEDPRDYRVSFSKIAEDMDFEITRTVADGVAEVLAAVAKGVFRNVDSTRYRN